MDNNKTVRISTITGLPVRKYTKKTITVEKPKVVAPPKPVFSNVVTYDNFETPQAHILNMGLNFTGKIKSNPNRKWSAGGSFYFSSAPTLNCQACSIAYFNIILQSSTDARKQLCEINRKTGKSLAIVDFRDNHLPKVNELFKDEIIFMKQYKSSNGSNMCLGMINVFKLRENE